MIRAGNRRRVTGFTLIEVLVTIAVIAVLASVVLVGYSAVQNRTFDAAVQTDLASNMKILTQFYADNSKFPTSAQIVSMSPRLGFVTSSYDTSGNNGLYCYSPDGQKASLISKSKTGSVYYVTNTSRIPTTFTPSFPQSGSVSCPDSGLPSGSPWAWVYDKPTVGWASWVK